LLYGRVCHPQTQGKVERFHRTLGGELRHRGLPSRWAEWPPLLAEVQREYNQRRPHEALGMRRPAELYQASPQTYQERPPEWEYPTGSEVKRLNTQGMLEEGGRRWFVCEALAGQRVRIERSDKKLLVSYRQMYIREIDKERACTRPLVVARREGAAAAGQGDPPVALPPEPELKCKGCPGTLCKACLGNKHFSPAEIAGSQPLLVSRPAQLFPTSCAGRETKKQLRASCNGGAPD